MAYDWNFLPSVISALSGLGGVWLGGQLTGQRERERENERIRKESSYLAILVIAHLDRYANCCLDVALDDGTCNGRPAGERGEFHAITVSSPSFDPLELKVDWKVLPTDLMYRILNLPYRAEQLANQIAGVFEYDYPPDYAEFFWERQHGFADLGLDVDELVKQLRVHAGLPTPIPKKGEWNRGSLLREKRDKLARIREQFEAQQMANHQTIPI